MKKICVLLLVQLLMIGTASYGAVSEDMSVYVRKDVFEVYMQNINANMERVLQRLDKIDEGLNTLNQTVANLSGRVDGLDKRMDSLDKRIDDLRNDIYLGLVILGIIVSWPKLKDVAQKWGKGTPSITLEDVRRLIEENNAKVLGKPQV